MTPRPWLLLPVAFWAGLATGLLRSQAPGGVVPLLAALAVSAAVAHRATERPLAALALAVAALGAASGALARAASADSCVARLGARPGASLRVTLRVEDPVSEAGGPGSALVDGCEGEVRVRWPAGRMLEAGWTVRAVGRWRADTGALGRPRGMLLVREVQVVSRDAAWLARLRGGAVGAMQRLYGRRAALVELLLLDRRGQVDRALLDRFADAGLVHLLSISGFHVGLITAWAVLLARLCRAGPVRALWLGAGVSALYVAWLGWPPPATRAVTLAALLALGRTRQRAVRPDALLLQSCLVVTLVDPWAVADLGAWLSAGSLWGATTATRWSDRTFGTGMLARTLAGSVGATAATAPLTAGALGAVSLAGIGLNFVAIPVAALAVPAVVLSLLLATVLPPASDALAAGGGLLLHALELLARAGAAVPGGHVVQEPGWRSALPWAGALAVLRWSIAGPGRGGARAGLALRRWTALAALAAWVPAVLSAWQPGGDAGAATLTLHFLDVGQGDGAVLRTPNGRWVVVDAGPRDGRRDAGRSVVVPFLRRAGARRLEAVVVSHAHADHLGGVRAVLERFPTTLVAEPGELVADPMYLELLDDVAARGIRWRPGRAGARLEVDGVRLAVLHPDTAWAEWGADLNEDSVVLLVEYGRFRALFAGDAGLVAEQRLRGRVGRVDVLKVGHHGSAGSTGDAWLRELRPRAAVVSVGARNRYGHPTAEALERLAAHRADVWRTDRAGTITVEVTAGGDSFRVRGARGDHGARGPRQYPVGP